MHIVETAASGYHGPTADDKEARDDADQLQQYAEGLQAQGYSVKVSLGYHNRVQELARITQAFGAELLVIGAHRHGGFFDFFYGETVDKVRHKLRIPVLVVS
jgi:manganese transport protein